MVATLEQQLQDLCDIHGLSSISIGAYSSESAGKFMAINVHSENVMGHANGRDKSVAELFSDAVMDLRTKQLIAVPDLAPMSVAL